MDEPTQTEICSMSIDTSIEDWEEMYQDWQQGNVDGFREMYGERVGTIHVERIPDDASPTNAIFTVYAELNPSE